MIRKLKTSKRSKMKISGKPIGILMVIITLVASLPMAAGKVMVNAKLDSTTMLMGTKGRLHLEVVEDKGVKGKFPLFESFGHSPFVGLLNDTIELGRDIKIDTVEVGTGRIQINYHVPIQVFDSGYYKLPKFEYVVGRDTARSEELLLTVVPVAGLTADTPISPLTGVADPENSSWLDNIPDWLYYYWWVVLAVALLAAGGVYLWLTYKKKGTLLPSKPSLPPYEVAIQALKRLKGRKLWETGHEKLYYTELTEILRRYLQDRFGIRALEMTSGEIMSHLADMKNSEVPREKMRDILDMADFVKFAMVRPLPDDNLALYNNAVDFVEKTRPAENPTEDKDKDVKTDNAKDDFVDVGRRGRKGRQTDSGKLQSEQRMKIGKKQKKGGGKMVTDGLSTKGRIGNKEGKEARK